MPTYKVKYQAGTYSGTISVDADDDEHALAKAKAHIRRQISLPMYSDSYTIVDSNEDDDYDV